ncbi:MAG: Crp/Fnr family transcriptional regulator [Candidatus Fluviicola riflensis]|nr:MAG: Crp/Fnr family transcriptional regulator [Candidatus Fluviicola riflensis]
MRELLIDSRILTLPKNEFLVKEGVVDQQIYYIESGAVRVFLQTEFEELTIRFGYKDSFITSLSSFVNGTPSEFYIQAIRGTQLRAISKQQFQAAIDTDIRYLQLYNAILEGLVIQQLEREVDLLTASPTERLQRVLQRSPQLFQEIPSKYIASYLRMTPETLSRVRKING